MRVAVAEAGEERLALVAMPSPSVSRSTRMSGGCITMTPSLGEDEARDQVQLLVEDGLLAGVPSAFLS